jgi:8-oxo-dGTP diphosphatase
MGQKPFTLSVKVIIRDQDGRCLLIQRASSSRGNPGKWEFPGGKVTLGEDFDQVVQREVSEETALTVCLQRALGTAQVELPTRKVVYLILEADWEMGAVQLSSEHEDYVWRYPHELLEMDLVRHFIPFVKRYAQGQI